MRYQVSRLDAVGAERFAAMTFPRYRPRLREAEDDAAVVAFGAESAAGPIGLALAELRPDEARAQLLSVFVAPACRGRGVATALLGRIERALSPRGRRELVAQYRTGQPTTPALERVLAKRGGGP